MKNVGMMSVLVGGALVAGLVFADPDEKDETQDERQPQKQEMRGEDLGGPRDGRQGNGPGRDAQRMGGKRDFGHGREMQRMGGKGGFGPDRGMPRMGGRHGQGPEGMDRQGPGPRGGQMFGRPDGGQCPGGCSPEALKAAGATDDQIKALAKSRLDAELKEVDARAAVEKAQMTLGQLLRDKDADESAVMKAADALNAAQGEQMKLRLGRRFAVTKILGKEVMEKLAKDSAQKCECPKGACPMGGCPAGQGPKGEPPAEKPGR
jgi:hypothetical protein